MRPIPIKVSQTEKYPINMKRLQNTIKMRKC